MNLESWIQPWPTWSHQWWGVMLRIVFAGAIIVIGAVSIRELFAEGGQISDLRTSLTLAGYVIFTMASLAMAIKPTRLTLVIGLLGIVALRTLDPAV